MLEDQDKNEPGGEIEKNEPGGENSCVEVLLHRSCRECSRWWSVADLYPINPNRSRCPHCDSVARIDRFEYHAAGSQTPADRRKLGILLEAIGKQLQKQGSSPNQGAADPIVIKIEDLAIPF